MNRIEALKATAWPDASWDRAGGPVVVADGTPHRISEMDGPIEAEGAHVVGVNDRWFDRLCEFLRARTVHFYEMRVADIGPLPGITGLEHLAIRWNTKLVDLSPLADLGALRTLVLEDTPKVVDLTPLSALINLEALEYSGGIWNKNRARTLAPLANLPRLAELQLLNISVEEDGLRPLADCAGLRTLEVSNQFQTDDYAFLSVRAPHIECAMLAPYVLLSHPIEDKDVMVVGKRKPFLNSAEDAEKLTRYETKFRKLQDEFAQQ